MLSSLSDCQTGQTLMKIFDDRTLGTPCLIEGTFLLLCQLSDASISVAGNNNL